MPTTQTVRPAGDSGYRPTARRRWRATAVGPPFLTPAALAALLVVAFIAITGWWLSQDRRVPDADNAKHLWYAFIAHDEISAGHFLAPFTGFNQYPPLVHLVGALGTFIAGVGEWQAILAQDLVFVPLLAAGCFGVARLAFGPRAGVLAVVFALGTPMVISQLHLFMLDTPEAAMVAISAWAILASDRFRRPGISAVAGLLCALGMLTKQTFVIFVAGLLVVVLVRGGWRNWRGVLAFAGVLAVIGAPWYIDHYSQLNGLTQGAAAAPTDSAANNAPGGITPPRYSPKNAGWYFWDLVNIQLLAPLAALFLIGAGLAVLRYLRLPRKDDLTPELFVGGLVSYLGPTYIYLKDARYTLPALVYIAVFASGWIAQARLRPRRLLVVVLAGIALMNTVAVAFGVGSPVRVTLPGGPTRSGLGERSFTLYSPLGYVRGGPAKDGDVLNLMRGLYRRGIRVIDFDPGTSLPDFNQSGLRAFARIANLSEPPVYEPAKLGPNAAFLLRHIPQEGDPPPCQRLSDGSGVYVELGNPLKPFPEYTFICPGRFPNAYHRTAPLPANITHNVTGQARRGMLHLMRAIHRAGIRTIEYDPVSMVTAYMDPPGLTRLATSVGLIRPPEYAPAKLGPRDVFLLRHAPVPGVPPCIALPDGSGIYAVLGNPLISFSRYRFYCPLRKPVLETVRG